MFRRVDNQQSIKFVHVVTSHVLMYTKSMLPGMYIYHELNFSRKLDKLDNLSHLSLHTKIVEEKFLQQEETLNSEV